MKGFVSSVCKLRFLPGDGGAPLMGFKQGSDLARFMVQKQHFGARVEQRTIRWKTWRPRRRRLLCLGRNGGVLDWGSRTRHGKRGRFAWVTLRK